MPFSSVSVLYMLPTHSSCGFQKDYCGRSTVPVLKQPLICFIRSKGSDSRDSHVLKKSHKVLSLRQR